MLLVKSVSKTPLKHDISMSMAHFPGKEKEMVNLSLVTAFIQVYPAPSILRFQKTFSLYVIAISKWLQESLGLCENAPTIATPGNFRSQTRRWSYGKYLFFN